MKGDKHRIVIIEIFTPYVNSVVNVYRHLVDNSPKLITYQNRFVDLKFDNHFQLQGIE